MMLYPNVGAISAVQCDHIMDSGRDALRALGQVVGCLPLKQAGDPKAGPSLPLSGAS